MAVTLMLAGCSAAGEEPPTAEAPPPAAPSTGAEVAAPAPASAPAPAPGGEAPASPAADPGERPAGRLAFIACEGERNPMCTKEYRPVCGEVDNGIRCVTTPCDSTDQREFGNACMACAEPKTTGYWPVACADLTTTTAP